MPDQRFTCFYFLLLESAPALVQQLHPFLFQLSSSPPPALPAPSPSPSPAASLAAASQPHDGALEGRPCSHTASSAHLWRARLLRTAASPSRDRRGEDKERGAGLRLGHLRVNEARAGVGSLFAEGGGTHALDSTPPRQSALTHAHGDEAPSALRDAP
ncbi:hypothetical protein AGIG_G20312 [Arapaima gigas]